MTKRFIENLELIKSSIHIDSLNIKLNKILDDLLYLESYATVISVFEKTIYQFESTKEPTFSCILPELARIEDDLKAFAETPSDETFVDGVARCTLEAFERKMRESLNCNFVMSAAFLDPSVKKYLCSICDKVPRWNYQEIVESVTEVYFLFIYYFANLKKYAGLRSVAFPTSNNAKSGFKFKPFERSQKAELGN